MPDRYATQILQHLADRRYRPQPAAQLALELGISSNDLDEFLLTVKSLVEEGQIVLGSTNTISLPPPGREMTGLFRLNRRGFGFLIPDSLTEHGDLFVPAGRTGGALTGDRVRARVITQRARAGQGRSPYIGQVLEIIQRSDKKYVGNLIKRGSAFLVEVDGHLLAQPVIIRDPHAKDAKVGDKVVIELIEYPSEDRPAQGVITEVLGQQGEPEIETLAVMRAYGLKDEYDPVALQQAREAATGFVPDQVPPGREDLTHELILTIDPPDARDFDDALHIHHFEQPQDDDAVWELGVHIADVAHFVPAGSPLDIAAQERGNSAYLPRKVIPMLPEVLSNGVCSLQEGVLRYTRSAFIRFDADGEVVGERFSRTVIRSNKRLTYLEAQALIDDDIREARKHTRSEPRYPSPLIQALKQMDQLAKVIRQRRLRKGMIVLDLPDVELVFDDSGRVIDAVPEDDAFTHKLIEMFMVEANEAVARLFWNLNTPMIRRIHADPPVHDMTELKQFAKVAGFHIPAQPGAKELQALLDATRGKPVQYSVHMAVLQTLSRAEYSPALIGHFALASEHYTHFTSPIRRYPDLIVHRGMDAYFDLVAQQISQHGKVNRRRLGLDLPRDPRCPSEDELMKLGRHCSTTERNAEAAEKDLRKYLVLDLLAQHLGDDYDGVVTGVSNEGVFVQLEKYLVDGFIRTADLSGPSAGLGERWRLNRITGALVALGSGRSISIGDRFVVRIANVFPARRQLDLVIVGDPGAPSKKKTDVKKPPRTQAPGASKAHKLTQHFKTRKNRRRPGR